MTDAQRLRVEADLTLSVDGVEARITGRDGRVVVETARPAALLRQLWLTGATLPPGRRGAGARQGLAVLRRHGITVELRTPDRTLVSVGRPGRRARSVAVLALAVLTAGVAARRWRAGR